jgi:transposase
MPKPHPAYPPEFRSKIVDLVRVGRKPGELAQEFNVCGRTVRNWVKQDDLDSGHRKDGLPSTEREELTRLRRENKPLQSGALHLRMWRFDPRKRAGENLAEGIVVACCRCLPTESFYTIGVVSSLN